MRDVCSFFVCVLRSLPVIKFTDRYFFPVGKRCFFFTSTNKSIICFIRLLLAVARNCFAHILIIIGANSKRKHINFAVRTERLFVLNFGAGFWIFFFCFFFYRFVIVWFMEAQKLGLDFHSLRNRKGYWGKAIVQISCVAGSINFIFTDFLVK